MCERFLRPLTEFTDVDTLEATWKRGEPGRIIAITCIYVAEFYRSIKILQHRSILRVYRSVASENCINNLDNFILIGFTRIVI